MSTRANAKRTRTMAKVTCTETTEWDNAIEEKIKKVYHSRVKQEDRDDAGIRALAAKTLQLNHRKPITSIAPNNGQIIRNSAYSRESILCYFPKLNDKQVEMVSTETNSQNNTATVEDGPSIAGKFSWTIVGKTIVPVISKNDGTRYVSVRIAESKVLSHFFQCLNPEVFNCVSVKSFSTSEHETKLLNEINSRHSEYHFGKEPFNMSSDFIVKLDDLVEFYNFMETCYNKLTHKASSSTSKCGFVRINDDSVVPYAVKNGQQYVPLFYFEGETDSLKTKAINLENWDLAYLKFCCKVQGIKNELFASEQCQVTSLEDVKSYFPEGTKFDEYWPNKLLDMQAPARNDVNGNHSWVQTPHVESTNVAQSTTVPNNHSMVNNAPQTMSASLQKQLHSNNQRVNSTAVMNNGTTNMSMYPGTATTWQQIGSTSNAVISQPYQVAPQTTQVYHQSRVIQKQPSAGNIHSMNANPNVMNARNYSAGQQARPAHVQSYYANSNTVPAGSVTTQQPPPLVRVTTANSVPNTYSAVSGGQNDSFTHVFQSSASLPSIYSMGTLNNTNKNLRTNSVHTNNQQGTIVQNSGRYPPALTPIATTGVLQSNSMPSTGVNQSIAQQQQQQQTVMNSRNHRTTSVPVASAYHQNNGEIIDLSSPPHSPQSTTNSMKRSAVVTNNVNDFRLNFNYPPLVRIDDVPAHKLTNINPPFKARTIQFKDKTVLAMNLKPFEYDNYVLTLPDVITNYFPKSDVSRIRHVLQNMFRITLYKGNVQQMQLLQSHHKSKSLSEEVPLIELKDLENYYAQLVYLESTMNSTDRDSSIERESKRQKVS